MFREFARSSRFIGAALAFWLASAATASSQTMRAHFIDVGQGAATLVEFPCAAILVDTGGEVNGDFDSNDELVSYLDDFFSRRTDLNKTFHLLVLTHPHIDHTRGVPRVLDRYKVLNAITNGLEPERASGGPGQKALHRKVAAGEATANDPSDDIGFVPAAVKDIPKGRGLTNDVIDPVKCPSVDPKITLLWGSVDGTFGWSKKTLDNLNNHSAVIRVDFGLSSLLITGDLEEDAIPDFLAHYKDSSLLNTDVYQVGHHGSANGTTDPLLRAVTPKSAVIAMGPPTRKATFSAFGFGHPRKKIIELLEQHVADSRDEVTIEVATAQHVFEEKIINRAIYGTGWDGTVILESDTRGTWQTIKPAIAPPRLINVNTATLEELTGLPMIGFVRAKAIVDHRTQQGRFTSIDKLAEVRGLGPATLNAIRSHVTAGN